MTLQHEIIFEAFGPTSVQIAARNVIFTEL